MPPANLHVLFTVAVALAILLILALRSSQLKHAGSQLRYLPHFDKQYSIAVHCNVFVVVCCMAPDACFAASCADQAVPFSDM